MLFDSQYRDLKNYLPWHRIQRMKDALRGIDAQKRRIHTSEQVHADSHQIIEHLEEMDCFKQAQTIMVYYPMDNEVDLRSLVKKYLNSKVIGGRIYTDREELERLLADPERECLPLD